MEMEKKKVNLKFYNLKFGQLVEFEVMDLALSRLMNGKVFAWRFCIIEQFSIS